MPEHQTLQKLVNHIGGFFLGKQNIVKLAVVSIMAEGHILIEDVPGVGKTLLAKVLAKSMGSSFHRIQFTPDLLPSDLTGGSIYHQPTSEFQFRPGPIFANFVLADEINRATPRTQSALLEAMGDGQVSIDGITHTLPPPFIVIATQNPYEFEGTYPLPENQLDRFATRLRLGYPPFDVEREILTQHRAGDPGEAATAHITKAEVIQFQKEVRNVRVDNLVANYLLSITEATRKHKDVSLGVSTRGALMHYRVSQAFAYLAGRDYVSPDDVKQTAIPVLGHRIVAKAAPTEGPSIAQDAGDAVIASLLQSVPVPN